MLNTGQLSPQLFDFGYTHRMHRRLGVLVDNKLNCGRRDGVARVKAKHQLEYLPLTSIGKDPEIQEASALTWYRLSPRTSMEKNQVSKLSALSSAIPVTNFQSDPFTYDA